MKKLQENIIPIIAFVVIGTVFLGSLGLINFNSLDNFSSLTYENYKDGYNVVSTSTIVDNIPEEIRDYALESNENYEVTYTKVTSTSSYDEICAYGVNNDILYPGAIVDISNESYRTIKLDRAPLIISADLESATGIDANTPLSAEIEKPSLSTVREGIRHIVASNIVDGANLPARYTLEIKDIKTEEEFYMNLGLGVKVKGFDIADNFKYDNINKQTNLVIVLKQVYYTISVDPDSDLFAWNVTTKQISDACGEGGIPAYVSSVSYGRIAIITIQTNYSKTEIENALKIAWNKDSVSSSALGVELENTIKDIATDSDTTVNCFIYGGNTSPENMSTLVTGDVESIFSTVFSSYDATSKECVGAPISYTLRHLNGELALLQDCQSYVVKNVSYNAQKIMSWGYLDKLIASGDIYNQEELTIDLSSTISSNYQTGSNNVENRVLKIPPNIKRLTIIGPNRILSDALAEQLSIEVAARGDEPLTILLDGISFSSCDGRPAIYANGNLNLEIQNEVRIYATEGQNAVEAGNLSILGNGSLHIYGGNGANSSDYRFPGVDGNSAIYASSLTISDILEELILYGGVGGNGAKGYDSNGDTENGGKGSNGGIGGIGLNVGELLIQKGTLTVYGGTGGAGGNGGNGDDGSSMFDYAGDGGSGGSGGSGGLGVNAYKITILKGASLCAYGGKGGNGGNGGNAGSVPDVNLNIGSAKGDGGSYGLGGSNGIYINCSNINNEGILTGGDCGRGSNGLNGKDS